ncbi:MAG: alpha/beta fold hydrolase [Phycisphaerales bacterium]|nr:alpha/beta fold hydrolase [Phycisphaerales bacterium]
MKGSFQNGTFRLSPHRAAEQRPIPTAGARRGCRRGGGPNRASVRPIAKRAGIGGTVSTLALILSACCSPESQFLRPLRITEAPPARAENVWIDAPSAGRLNAWLFRPEHAPPDRPIPAVLFLHGRSDSIATYRDLAPWFADRVDAAMLVVDYRGWGASSDIECPSRRSIIADAGAAYDWLAARDDIDESRIAIWGASLGGYPATSVMAERTDAVALALWASVADAIWLIDDFRDRLSGGRWLAARLALRRYREPRDQVRRIGDRPVLIVHGERDEIIPVRHAHEIAARAQAAGVPADLFIDPESTHMVVSEEAILRIAVFLRERLHAGESGTGDSAAPEESLPEGTPPPSPRVPPRTSDPPASNHGAASATTPGSGTLGSPNSMNFIP